MSSKRPVRRLILVEDDDSWVARIAPALERFTGIAPEVIRDYAAAEAFLDGGDLTKYSGAVIDVRMREQIYDQGGLALLDIVKVRVPSMPVLVLTAYADDYPGLRRVTTRYEGVLTYDKTVFLESSDTVLGSLLLELPPQIGDSSNQDLIVKREMHPTAAPTNERPSFLREVLGGATMVLLVLAAAVGTLLLFQSFSRYSLQLNIVFSVVIITLICVLIRIFKPEIVSQAVGVYRQLEGRGDSGGMNGRGLRKSRSNKRRENGAGRRVAELTGPVRDPKGTRRKDGNEA